MYSQCWQERISREWVETKISRFTGSSSLQIFLSDKVSLLENFLAQSLSRVMQSALPHLVLLYWLYVHTDLGSTTFSENEFLQKYCWRPSVIVSRVLLNYRFPFHLSKGVICRFKLRFKFSKICFFVLTRWSKKSVYQHFWKMRFSAFECG